MLDEIIKQLNTKYKLQLIYLKEQEYILISDKKLIDKYIMLDEITYHIYNKPKYIS